MKEPNKPELKTRAGLNYFRQERDETKLTDEQLLDLYDKIEELECDITRPDWRKWMSAANARAPFDKLPCHRDIAVEIQGEKWVTEKEAAEEKSKLAFLNRQRKLREKEEYKINSLRNL